MATATHDQMSDKHHDAENGYDSSSLSSSEAAQAGVKTVEAVTLTWTYWSLVAAYISIFLIATTASFDGQTIASLSIIATSSFGTHSLISVVYVVQGVVNACIKPVMAKIANVFGRLEAFSFSILLYVLGYIQQASSHNIQTYASAQIFYSAGFTGVLILTQIFIADTSDLRFRAMLSSLPDVPFLFTVWIGPYIASAVLPNWRWGYGMWAIILPTAFIPLALALFFNTRKAKKRGYLPPRPWAGMSFFEGIKSLWFELDVFGILLLCAAISLLLIPLTLAATAKDGWRNASIIAMLVIGFVCLCVFPFWESNKKLAPFPFIPLRMLRRRNVAIGCVSGFFYFAVFYTSILPYFNTYLQVVQGQSVVAAGHITQVFSFSSTATSVIVGILIYFVKQYKYFVVAGSALYLTGIGLMIRYRQENVSIATNVGVQIAVGIGGGLYNVPIQLAVQSVVPHQDVAAVTALLLTVIEIGGAVGSAVSGVVWSGNLPDKLAAYLPPSASSQALTIYGDYTQALVYAAGTPERIAINRAYQETMDILLTVSVCFAAPIFILSLFLKNVKLDEVDQKVRGKVIGRSNNGPSVDTDDTLATNGRVGRSGFWQRWRR